MKILYRRTYLPFFLIILALGGLYAASIYNYDLFLSLASLLSIAIALGIFILVWTSRNYLGNNYLLFIGIAYLFIGVLQMAHTLALQAIYEYGESTSEHLWVATHYVESLTFLAAPLFIGHKLRPRSVFLAYAIITPILLITIILWNLSQVASTRGGGQALFTDTSQYLIALIFASAILLLFQKHRSFNPGVLRLLVTAMTITASVGVVSAIVKTNDELIHMIEHLAQLASLGFIFQAVVDAGLTRPYQLILRDLSQSREALRHERDTAQKYLDIAGVIFVAIDTGGKVTMINRKGCEVLGYPEEEIVGKDWFDNFLPPRLKEEAKSVAQKLLSGEIEATEYYENPVLTRSGEERIIAWHNVLLKGDDGSILGHLSSGEDITERKRAEGALRESEEELRRMFSSVTDGIVVTNLDGIITDANEKAVHMYGCSTARELIGANSLKLVNPTDLPKVMADMNNVLGTGANTSIEYGVTRRDGSRFPSETSTSVLKDASGRPTGFISVIRDVTAQKQAEEKLQESEARYRALFETKLEGTFVIDETMKIVLANQAVADMFGFDSIEELYEINLLEYIMPEFHEWAIEHITEGLFQEDRRGLYEIRCMKKNGDEIWVSVTGVRTEYNGKPIGIISIRDITDRKRMAEAIAQSAQRYRSLFENMPAGFIYGKIITDENDKPVDALCLEVNDGIEELTGIKKEQLIGRRFSEIMPTLTESNPDLFDVLGEVATTGESARFEDYFKPLSKWVASTIYSPEKGYFTALFEDITERKQTEEIFRTVSLRSPAGMYVVQDGKFVFANPRFFVNGGTTEDELLGTHSLDRVHPDDREMVRQNAIAMLKGERTTPYEYRLVNDKGEISAWLSETVVPIQYQGKRAVLGNVVDITEQKQAEEIFRTISLSSPASIYISQDGKFVFANPRLLNRMGYTEEGLSNIEPQSLVHPEDREMARQCAVDMLKGKRTTSYEYRVFSGTGEMLWVAETVASIQYRGRRAVLGSLLDITERKQAEEETQTVLKTALDGFWVSDIKGKFLQVNDSYCQMIGYTQEELLKMSIPDIEAVENPEETARHIETIIEQGHDRFETKHRCKDGRIIDVEVSVNHLDVGEGRQFVFVRDITEQKQAEEIFRTISLSSPVGMYIVQDEKFVFANPQFLKDTGFTEKELLGRKALALVYRGDRKIVQKNAIEMLKGTRTTPYEFRITSKAGETKWFMETVASIQYHGKRASLGNILDITERKQAEESLQESEARYRALFETKLDGVIVIDETTKILLANQAVADMFGFDSIEEMYEINLLDYIMPEFHEWAIEHITVGLFKEDQRGLYEIRCTKKNGDEMWVSVTGVRTEYRGKPAGIISTRDITERKRMEEALRRSEESFRAITESAHQAIITIDTQTRIVLWNKAAEKTYGYSADKAIGQPLTLIIPERLHQAFQDEIEAMLSSQNSSPPSGQTEAIRLRKDGTEFPVRITVAKWQAGDETFLTCISFDITEQKQAEERLKESELQYRQLVETSPDMIITTDLKGNLLFVNKEWKKRHGYLDREIKRTSILSILHPDDMRAVKAAFTRVMRGHNVSNIECRTMSKNGSYINILANLSPVTDSQGKVTNVLIASMDITERKQAEEIFQTMSLKSPVSMYIVQDGKFVFANPQFVSDLGVTEDRIIGAKSLARVRREDREVVRQNAIEMLKGERTTPYEYGVTDKTGETKWFMETVAPIQYKGKRAVLGSVLDITERKKNEERLVQTRRRFRDLVNLLPLSVSETDADGNIIFANKVAIESSGYTEEELRVAPLGPVDIFIPEDRERVWANIQRLLNGEDIGPQEYSHLRKDGSTCPVITYSAPIMQEGKAVGLRTVTIDVSEQKEAERKIADKNRELEEVNAQLMEVDRLKSIFLSSMSHELRTPLNSIIGFTSLILDGMTGDINEEQREQLTLVKSSSNHLLSLINDVLDISKIEAGKVELSLEEFSLNELISEVVDILTPAAQTKGIELTAETDGDIQVHTDRRRFKQVLINLGGNAVKFTEQGSVRITAGLHEENGHIHDDSLEVHVIDTGIGIKKEDIDKLFAPFQQVDGSLTRRFEGTGLGLHHSKKILNMLGGDIWVKSKYGKGSDFGLILPLKYRGDENNEENTGGG